MAFDHPLGNKEVTQSAHLEPENISLDLFQPLRCLFAGFLFLFGNGVKRLIGLKISFLETNRRRGWVAVAKRIRSLRVGRFALFQQLLRPGHEEDPTGSETGAQRHGDHCRDDNDPDPASFIVHGSVVVEWLSGLGVWITLVPRRWAAVDNRCGPWRAVAPDTRLSPRRSRILFPPLPNPHRLPQAILVR